MMGKKKSVATVFFLALLAVVGTVYVVQTHYENMELRQKMSQHEFDLVQRLFRSPPDIAQVQAEVKELQLLHPPGTLAKKRLVQKSQARVDKPSDQVRGYRRRARVALVEWQRSRPQSDPGWAEAVRCALEGLKAEVTGDEAVDQVLEFLLASKAVSDGSPESDRKALVQKLWQDARELLSPSRRLRAALALVVFDPKGPDWKEVAADPVILNTLLGLDPLLVDDWAAGIRPVRESFVPHLERAYQGDLGDISFDQAARAAQFLAKLTSDDAQTLVSLITKARIDLQVKAIGAGANPPLMAIVNRLKQLSGPPRWEAEKLLKVATQSPDWKSDIAPPNYVAQCERLSLEHKKKFPDFLLQAADQLSQARGNAAAALVALGKKEGALAVLRHEPDPFARSYLIHLLGPFLDQPGDLASWLQDESDTSVRRAILLALGEYQGGFLDAKRKTRIVEQMTQAFKGDSDPGVHAAAEWALSRWGEAIPDIRQTLEGKAAGADLGTKRRWYVGANGHTMVVLPAPDDPGVVLMGTPTQAYPDYNAEDEPLHLRRIPRRFAIAAKETTIEQFEKFIPGFFERKAVNAKLRHYEQGKKKNPKHPAFGFISWIHATAYCNWLSSEAGIAPPWCYPYTPKNLNEFRQVVPEDPRVFLAKMRDLFPVQPDETSCVTRRLGYRLPTEVEWEYSCRAGSVTPRYYGRDDKAALLPFYANFRNTSPTGQPLPVAVLKPNDFGLFDVLGNVAEWCHVRSIPPPCLPYNPENIIEDRPRLPSDPCNTYRDTWLVVRGGSLEDRAVGVRSAYRIPQSERESLDLIHPDYGFRVVRTLP